MAQAFIQNNEVNDDEDKENRPSDITRQDTLDNNDQLTDHLAQAFIQNDEVKDDEDKENRPSDITRQDNVDNNDQLTETTKPDDLETRKKTDDEIIAEIFTRFIIISCLKCDLLFIKFL